MKLYVPQLETAKAALVERLDPIVFCAAAGTDKLHLRK